MNRAEHVAERLDFMSRVSQEAGAFILEHLGQVESLRTKSSDLDLLTEVDEGSQRLILERLQERFPADAVLAEEGGETAPSGLRVIDAVDDTDAFWLVDPLDGTMNFVHTLPNSGVTLAYAAEGQVLAGAFYDPYRQELFTAQRGRGAWLNGKPIRVDGARNLSEALMAAGLPYDPKRERRVNVGAFAAILDRSRAMRSLGSAAMQLAYVACGRLTGYWELRLAPWDLAAGILMVEEAGGRVTTVDGRPFELRGPTVLATNGQVHDEVLGVFREALADDLPQEPV